MTDSNAPTQQQHTEHNCYNCRFAVYHPEEAGSVILEQAPEDAWFECRPPGQRPIFFPAFKVDQDIATIGFSCPHWAPCENLTEGGE